MKQIIVNAQVLTFAGPLAPRAGAQMGRVGPVREGAVLFEGENILSAGTRDAVKTHPAARAAREIDAGGRVLMPGFVDCHTHPVFAGPRLKDFELRGRGLSYQEIAREGGGILSSMRGVRGSTQRELSDALSARALDFLSTGTTLIEAKSGYGLDLEGELKMLRAIRHARAGSALEMVPTFLGAHALPPEYAGKAGDFVDFLCRELLPAVAKEGLARGVDAFVERGYFSPSEAETFLQAGRKAGLSVRVHAEQLSRSGGALLAARLKADSADHLDFVEKEDLRALREAGTVAVLAPGSNHFLGLEKFPDARGILDAGVPVALATDLNPGTCPCWNMQEIVSIAVCRMKMTAEEALTAATVNGAYALGLGKSHGSLEAGRQADLLLLDCKDHREVAYWFGANLTKAVWKKGRLVHGTP